MAILSKECKPGNFEPCKSLKLKTFLNKHLRVCSNFAEYESFLESNSPDILALWETNLDDSIDSDNFSVRCYLLMHGLSFSVKEGPPFARELSLENSADSYLCFGPTLL